jgi:hypothetical protein
VYRYVAATATGVFRYTASKYMLVSVRCKKD